MFIRVLVVALFTFSVGCGVTAQQQYLKNPDSAAVMNFPDTLNRVKLTGADSSNALLKGQFDYILRFYPNMLVKNIRVEFKESMTIAKTKPLFSSLLKAPDQRTYKVTFSKLTKSTLDSVLLNQLSFNAQLGLIAKQISQIEDLSTGGFLDQVAWYFRQLTRRGKNRIQADAEKRTLEVGLGYQLLALNLETSEKLRIENWKSVKGYAGYVKYTKIPSMKPYLIDNFISDLPVYVTQSYK